MVYALYDLSWKAAFFVVLPNGAVCCVPCAIWCAAYSVRVKVVGGQPEVVLTLWARLNRVIP